MPLKWQGQRVSNPQPSVLETDALPIELYPYFILALYQIGAGDGNRTHIASLEGWSFTTKLRPHLCLPFG